MIIKRGRLTESGVELGGLGFIGDIQGFWKRAPFILVTGIAHIWWLAQLTAVPGNKIGTDMCRIFLIAVTTTPFTPIAADAFPKAVTIVLTGMTFPGISGIFNNSCAIYFLRNGGRVFVYDRCNGAECTSLYQFLFSINSFSQC